MKKTILIIVTCILGTTAFAQIEQPVKWSYAAKRISATEAMVLIKATIDEGWHIYSQKPVEGPINTTFSFNPSKTYTLTGKTVEPKPITKYEKTFKVNVSYFEKEAVFQQKIRLKSPAATTVTGKLEYMVCNEIKCLPPEEIEFSVPVKVLGK